MVEVRRVGSGAVSELSFNDPSQVIDQITRYPIVANEQVLSSKIVAAATSRNVAGRSLSYTIPEGKRAVAIPATEVSDVGGLVLPGDYVDVLVVYDVEFEERTADNFLVQTLLQNVEVLAVAQAVVDTVSSEVPGENGQRVRNTDAGPNAEAATITLAVTPEEAQKLVLAQTNGEVRLSLRAFGDGTQKPIEFLVEPDLLPANLPRPR
jgi:pilus assembly protein CpaB